jgi:alpha-tubulin suppressor-like RCC1 family protein
MQATRDARFVRCLLARSWSWLSLLILVGLSACGGGGGSSGPGPEQVVLGRLEVSPSAALLTERGATQKLTVRAFDVSGREIPNPPLSFVSSTPAQVSVDQNGNVRAEAGVGSATISISSGTVQAIPVGVTAVETVAPAVLVADSQVVAAPRLVEGSPTGIGARYTATVRGVGVPAVGSVMLASGGSPIAGTVVAASAVADGTVVTLEVVPLNQLVRNASVAFSFTPEQMSEFARKASADAEPRGRRSAQRALPQALFSRKYGIFDCSADFDTSLYDLDVTATVTSDLAAAIALNVVNGVSQDFLLQVSGKIGADLTGTVKVLSASGSADCRARLAEIPIPVTGWFSIFVSPVVPIDAKTELRTSVSSNLTYGVQASAEASLTVGLKWDRSQGWVNINSVDASGTLDISPSFLNTASRVTVTTFGGLTAGITVGNALGTLENALEVVGGPEFTSSWGLPYDAAVDPIFDSKYQQVTKAAVGPGDGLQAFVERIFGNVVSPDVSFAREWVWGYSPVATSVVVSQAEFPAGAQLNFTVALDRTRAQWGPLSVTYKDRTIFTPYNIQEIVIYALNHADKTATAIARVAASPGQYDFVIPWTATAAGRATDSGRPTFYAFAVPVVFPFLRSSFPVELGEATAQGLSITPSSVTLAPGVQQTFSASSNGVPLTTGIAWSATGGTIDGSGRFTAGSGTGTYEVTATRTSSGESATALVQIASGAVAPAITGQPQNAAVTVGQTATFTVAASGTAPLVYQWSKNGVNVNCATGANCPTYTTPASTTADDGAVYSVMVSNSSGSVSSAGATLTVRPVVTSTSDLVAQSISFTPTNVSPGELMQVSFTIANVGTVQANASTAVVRVTTSNTSAAGANAATGDIPLIAAGGSLPATAYVTVPTTPGTYYVWVIVDNTKTAGQSAAAEANDIALAPGTLTVGSGLPPGGAVTISSASCTSPVVGQQMECTVVGTNLPATTSFSATNCAPSPMTVLIGGSLDQRKFACTPVTAGVSVEVSYVVPGAAGPLPAVPTRVATDLSPGSTVGRLGAGGLHTCAVSATGGVKCWGHNNNGQLGDGSNVGRLTPVNVLGLSSGVTAVAAGEMFTCALTGVGAVKCWGNGQFGQLGDNSYSIRSTPVDVVGLSTGMMAIVAGRLHTCALSVGGGVKCWGSNNNGQLGDGSITNRTTPVDVFGLSSGVMALTAGEHHTCALMTSGGVKCWGLNTYNQLGDSPEHVYSTPVDVVGLASGVKALAAGFWHTCALTGIGGVKCWGANFNGQIGDNSSDTTIRPAPVDVVGLTGGVIAIAAGWDHSCALTGGGGVKCWGGNYAGQVGDNSKTNRAVPVDVVGLSGGVIVISTGDEHTCALTSGGGAKCWGNNYYGQLGDNSTTERLTPVDVVGF